MLGGYQILDLRSIDLSRGTSEASISDAYVLTQLLHIRDHIQKTYDFSKPLHNQLKPLLIRYRDKKVGEKHEVALYGNIEVINSYYKFRIIASNEGEQLTINVEFEEKTDEYDNKYWDIKTAKVLLTSAETTIANILASGNIENAKPIYWHTIKLQRGGTPEQSQIGRIFGYLIILNNSPEPFTLTEFQEMLATEGITFVLHSGLFSGQGASNLNGCGEAFRLVYKSANSFDVEYLANDGTIAVGGAFGISTGWVIFEDLGANKIN